MAEQADHAAKSLLEDSSVNDDLGRINLVMQRVFSRAATSEEQEGALAFLALARDAEAGSGESAWSSLFLSLFSIAEFRYLVDIE